VVLETDLNPFAVAAPAIETTPDLATFAALLPPHQA
jgi:hypothetical protein